MHFIPESLKQAYGFHQSGDLQNAERCYRQLLQQEPRNVDGWHMLGLVGLQTGRSDWQSRLFPRR